jgi:hypothetical protein
MRRLRTGLKMLTLALAIIGCAKNQKFVPPPKHPDEYKLPPDQDARFSKPVEYPNNVLNEDKIRKPADPDANVPGKNGGPGGKFGGGPGAGTAGM